MSFRFLIRVLGIILFLGLWEGNARLELYRLLAPTLQSTYFPTFSQVADVGLSVIADQMYLNSLLLTVARTLAAFVIAASIGVVLALLTARSVILDDFTYYPFEFLRQLPAVAIIPIAIILFGIFTTMKVVVAAFGCFFPVFVATREGLKSVNKELMLTARLYGWRGPRLLFGVMLPSAVPHIIASWRIALAIALILIIMCEMYGGGDGLGDRLVVNERSFNYPALYAETFLLGMVGVSLNLGLGLVSRKLYFWQNKATWG